jgi:hypothetical protein
MRLLSPDHACKQVDAPSGRRYSGTVLDVTNPGDVRALRAAGYTAASVAGSPAQTAGRTCRECGFKSFFTTCSRCGGACSRGDEPTPTTGEAA